MLKSCRPGVVITIRDLLATKIPQMQNCLHEDSTYGHSKLSNFVPAISGGASWASCYLNVMFVAYNIVATTLFRMCVHVLHDLSSLTYRAHAAVVQLDVATSASASAQNAGDNLEADFDRAMTELRKHYATECLGKKLSFALKQRQIESRLVEYALSFARMSISHRQAVVHKMTENVDLGPGHLSVNRAKQALKLMAASTGLKSLLFELKSEDTNFCWQAVQLLGWLKDSKAIDALLDAYVAGDEPIRSAISAILRRHYAGQFEWHAIRFAADESVLHRLLI